jgi:hypothetical protein
MTYEVLFKDSVSVVVTVDVDVVVFHFVVGTRRVVVVVVVFVVVDTLVNTSVVGSIDVDVAVVVVSAVEVVVSSEVVVVEEKAVLNDVEVAVETNVESETETRVWVSVVPANKTLQGPLVLERVTPPIKIRMNNPASRVKFTANPVKGRLQESYKFIRLPKSPVPGHDANCPKKR